MWTLKSERSITYLYPTVTPVCHNNIPIAIYSHTGGCVELAVPFAMWTKFEQELSISIVNLQEVVNPEKKRPQKKINNVKKCVSLATLNYAQKQKLHWCVIN